MFRFPRRMMAVLALASLLHLDAHATENGQISYPVGVNTVLNGVLPPPGERNSTTIRFTTWRISSRDRTARVWCQAFISMLSLTRHE